ncbi:hypothetical protein B005_4388 [Nocardiopsis alba ATCC BAA-2165]|uniref:Uncharacterized protein n=1 Tax=Nocardiopsis alba (strain ATCC BAA-2165 / BE74) TaxID=1205910 RepID=J7LED9_NOCAA|nr:hypothetical protein B005_4388 [Nocardiopsis alba ATCC BAA-2165]
MIVSVSSRERGVHPRVRGEQDPWRHRTGLPPGPSPRARGAVRPAGRARRLVGVIPACAGSRATPRETADTTEGHPRVRGEQQSVTASVNAGSGSSPRARGAGGFIWFLSFLSGVIPACAGSRS